MTCTSTTCTYGPICPDGWGGCYFYTWRIGSAVNTYEEKAGLAKIINLCDPSNPDTCVFVSSKVIQTLEEPGPTALIVCQVPGADTCTDGLCGGSPNSGGAVFLRTLFAQTTTSVLNENECSKDDKDKKGIKCRKTNNIPGLEGDSAAAATYCPNSNWKITKWIPLNFYGETTATGPASRQDPTLISTTATAHCWLLDPQGRKPSEEGYQLSSNLSENQLYCENL